MIFNYIISLTKWCFFKLTYGKKFKVGFINSFKLDSVKLRITKCKESLVYFKGRCFCRNVTFNANGGIIEMGDHVFLNDGVNINSQNKVTIGDRTIVGQNVLIYDHDHDYHNLDRMRDEFITDEVTIGKDVWIGSGVIILRGTVIGDRTIIGAGTVVKGKISSDVLVYTDRKLLTKPLIREEI